jgi:hypothetical protein
MLMHGLFELRSPSITYKLGLNHVAFQLNNSILVFFFHVLS